ncbi:MAG: hypothetical protein ABJC13_02495 [Acidobacteriota bacterium]
MWKHVAGVFVGLLVWIAVALVAGVLLRWFWPEYVAASGAMAFTLPMMLTRLSIGALATIAAGALAARLGQSNRAAIFLGAVLLVIFVPMHVHLWDKFPPWYHLTFLASLVPLAVFGGRMAQRGPKRGA